MQCVQNLVQPASGIFLSFGMEFVTATCARITHGSARITYGSAVRVLISYYSVDHKYDYYTHHFVSMPVLCFDANAVHAWFHIS